MVVLALPLLGRTFSFQELEAHCSRFAGIFAVVAEIAKTKNADAWVVLAGVNGAECCGLSRDTDDRF